MVNHVVTTTKTTVTTTRTTHGNTEEQEILTCGCKFNVSKAELSETDFDSDDRIHVRYVLQGLLLQVSPPKLNTNFL